MPGIIRMRAWLHIPSHIAQCLLYSIMEMPSGRARLLWLLREPNTNLGHQHLLSRETQNRTKPKLLCAHLPGGPFLRKKPRLRAAAQRTRTRSGPARPELLVRRGGTHGLFQSRHFRGPLKVKRSAWLARGFESERVLTRDAGRRVVLHDLDLERGRVELVAQIRSHRLRQFLARPAASPASADKNDRHARRGQRTIESGRHQPPGRDTHEHHH